MVKSAEPIHDLYQQLKERYERLVRGKRAMPHANGMNFDKWWIEDDVLKPLEDRLAALEDQLLPKGKVGTYQKLRDRRRNRTNIQQPAQPAIQTNISSKPLTASSYVV